VGRIEPARVVGLVAADERGGALGDGVLDVSVDVGAAGLGGQRADVGGVVHRVTDDKGAHLGDEQVQERVVDAGVDEEPLAVYARLPVV
jgi:hypothetical protein